MTQLRGDGIEKVMRMIRLYGLISKCTDESCIDALSIRSALLHSI